MIPDSPTIPLPPLIVILGPTASGKTDLAAELAKEFNGEIINADSRQVYKEIDSASAKPTLSVALSEVEGPQTEKQYRGIPHHLFDIVKPNEPFNVTHFKHRAVQTINEIHERGRLPFLVGGTGLWISAVVDNLKFPPIPPNRKLRRLYSCHPEPDEGDTAQRSAMLRQAQHDITTEKLFQELTALDPAAASFINPHNRRRIVRALEVIRATGRPFSEQRKKSPPLFNTLELGLTWPMEILEERIAKRLGEQVKEGLIEEARKLFSKYEPRLPALSSISLREWAAYFEGNQTREETLALIRMHNRQYAKRQMTWFKRDKRIKWITNGGEARTLVQEFLELPETPS